MGLADRFMWGNDYPHHEGTWPRSAEAIAYLDPAYRDRAIRIVRDEQNLEVLLIDGKPLKTLRGQLGALGGIDMDTAKLLTRGQISYAEGSPPGSYDPAARLRVMDGEGIDAVLLYQRRPCDRVHARL